VPTDTADLTSGIPGRPRRDPDSDSDGASADSEAGPLSSAAPAYLIGSLECVLTYSVSYHDRKLKFCDNICAHLKTILNFRFVYLILLKYFGIMGANRLPFKGGHLPPGVLHH
jgi:hypothetical protein